MNSRFLTLRNRHSSSLTALAWQTLQIPVVVVVPLARALLGLLPLRPPVQRGVAADGAAGASALPVQEARPTQGGTGLVG